MSGSAAPAMAPQQGAARSLRDRLLGIRDRLVGDPRFRDWAARFPLTRPLARRRARSLFDLAAGFVYSQVLAACVRVRLFDLLHREGPLGAGEIAGRIGLDRQGTLTLLRAAESLALIESRGGDRWGLATLGAAMIGNDGLTAMVEHHAMLYRDLADPLALLRRGPSEETELARYWAYARADAPDALKPGDVGDYTALMAASQDFIAAEVLDAWPALGARRGLIDMGGGDGSFLRAVAARHPKLDLVLFDLPPVAARAEARFAAAGLGARARCIGGSFLDGGPPAGLADTVSLVRVVHDHDDGAVMRILRAARAALPPGGTLMIAEPMSATPGAEPVGGAYFGFYLLAMGSGRPRTAAELAGMLAEAGFAPPRERPTATPLLVRVLLADAV